MDIDKILTLVDPQKIMDAIVESNKFDYDPAKLQEVYDGKHEIVDARQPKPITDSDGNTIDSTPVAKMVLNYQQKIVESSVAFLFGKQVELIKTSEGGDEAFKYLIDTLNNMHWHTSNRQLARKEFTQRRSAKLFYIKNPDVPEKMKLTYKVLSVENGVFFPNFADDGDMDAFLRLYTGQDIKEGAVVDVEMMEMWTELNYITGIKVEGAWVQTSVPNPFLKIPVVYYEQAEEEWKVVDSLIPVQEVSLSELVDTNKYNSAPIPVINGEVKDMPAKGDQGKVIEFELSLDGDGKAIPGSIEYLTWDELPESLKLQFDMTDKYIYTFSSTADVSFRTMLENKPGQVSGIAMKFMMQEPVLKSKRKQEEYDANIQRELSVVQSIAGTMETKYAKDYTEMKIDVTFPSALPENTGEIIDAIATANGNKAFMSVPASVNANPLTKDKEKEIDLIAEESQLEAGTAEE